MYEVLPLRVLHIYAMQVPCILPAAFWAFCLKRQIHNDQASKKAWRRKPAKAKTTPMQIQYTDMKKIQRLNTKTLEKTFKNIFKPNAILLTRKT